MLVVGHDIVRAIEQALGPVREAHREKIRVRALTAAPFGMHDKVLDLEKAVQAEVPIGDFLRSSEVTGVELDLADLFHLDQHEHQ